MCAIILNEDECAFFRIFFVENETFRPCRVTTVVQADIRPKKNFGAGETFMRVSATTTTGRQNRHDLTL